MGDEVLKKTVLLLLPILFCSILLADKNNEFTAEYDKIFTQISEKRIGISNSKINVVKNPFLMTNVVIAKENNTTAPKIKYNLNAIFGNKAKINGKWYKLNSEIGSFKLSHVKSNSVIMQNGHSKKELFIRKSDVSKIQFNSK